MNASRSLRTVLFSDIVPQPWLGGVAARGYEEAGDPERTIDAWSWIVGGWSEADPELEPRVREAENEIERLRRSRS